MGLLGVGLMLPNSPGLVGQFQWFTLLGLSLYLGFDARHPPAEPLAFAIAQHLLQVVWYVAMGGLGLASRWVSFHDLWAARSVPDDSGNGDDAKPALPPRATVKRLPSDQKLAPELRSADDRVHAPDRP
jgi:hypothetical protein